MHERNPSSPALVAVNVHNRNDNLCFLSAIPEHTCLRQETAIPRSITSAHKSTLSSGNFQFAWLASLLMWLPMHNLLNWDTRRRQLQCVLYVWRNHTVQQIEHRFWNWRRSWTLLNIKLHTFNGHRYNFSYRVPDAHLRSVLLEVPLWFYAATFASPAWSLSWRMVSHIHFG